jgi:hypothetical protein
VSSAKPDSTFWKTFLFSWLCEQLLFFKYFSIHTLVLEKICADDVICSCLGLNESNSWYFFIGGDFLEKGVRMRIPV